MKLRIKGNSLRLRLTKSDLDLLADKGEVVENICLPGSSLTYLLCSDDSVKQPEAAFDGTTIQVTIPRSFAKDWATNTIVGTSATLPVNGNQTVFILIEKDFQCLDETTEDQSDNFTNPRSLQ